MPWKKIRKQPPSLIFEEAHELGHQLAWRISTTKWSRVRYILSRTNYIYILPDYGATSISMILPHELWVMHHQNQKKQRHGTQVLLVRFERNWHCISMISDKSWDYEGCNEASSMHGTLLFDPLRIFWFCLSWALCPLCSHSLASCHLKTIFLGFSEFFWFESVSRIFCGFPIWTLFSEISLILFDLNLFSRTTGNGLEADELGLGGLLACCGLCTLFAPTPWPSVIWKLFWWFYVFFSDLVSILGCSIFFLVEGFFPIFFSGFLGGKVFSRTTGNGLENDEFGLGGLLACCGLCTLCAPPAWLSVIWFFWCFFWFSFFS